MRFACALEHLVHRVEQRRQRPLAALPSPRSTSASTSCHSSVANRKAGDTPLAFAHARRRCSASASVDEALAERLLEDHVEQRQQAVRQAVRAQALQRLERVPGQQQLLHLVEQPRRRDVLHQRGELGIGAAVFGSIARPSFAASRTARSMRTGSSR